MPKNTDLESLAKKSAQDEDQLLMTKTIYDVSYREIVFRNFTAGASRAVGWFLFQLVILAIIGAFFFQYIWPVMVSMTNSLQSTAQFFTDLQEKAAASWWGGGSPVIEGNPVLNGVLNFVPRLLQPAPSPTLLPPLPESE